MHNDDSMKAKGLVFDYGGTLDTGGNHWGRVLWQAYVQSGVAVTEQQLREAYVYAERYLAKTPVICPDDTFRQTLAAKVELQFRYLHSMGCEVGQSLPVVEAAYAVARRCTAHSREVLQLLHEQFPLALVSNFYGNIHTVLREFGFDGLFRAVIESAAACIRKPDARIFSMGVEALDLPPQQVVVVGDSLEKDILPAQEAGCQTVWLRGQGWTDEEPDSIAADAVISDLAELLMLPLYSRT